MDQSTFYGNASALNSQTPTIVRNSVFSPGICSYYYGVAGEIISEGNNVLQDTSLDASQYLFNCGFVFTFSNSIDLGLFFNPSYSSNC